MYTFLCICGICVLLAGESPTAATATQANTSPGDSILSPRAVHILAPPRTVKSVVEEGSLLTTTEGEEDLSLSSPLDDPEPWPWYSYLSYSSSWALFVVIFCYNWSFYLLVSYLPKYLNYVLGYSKGEAGNLAVIAYLGLYLSILLGGKFNGRFIAAGFNVTKVRKTAVTVGFWPPMILILLSTFFTDRTWNATCLVVAIALTGIAQSGFAPNPMDLNPHAPALIASFGNVLGTMPGFMSAMIAGPILEHGDCDNQYPMPDSCVHSWHLLFYLSIGMYLFGWTIWMLFSSGYPLRRRPALYSPIRNEDVPTTKEL